MGAGDPTEYLGPINEFLNKYKKASLVDWSMAINQKDQVVLSVLIQKFKPKVIIETGTNRGLSAAVMALAGGEDVEIHTFDIPNDAASRDRGTDPDTFGIIFKGTPLEKRITATAKSTFEIQEEKLPRADLWFIDSSHYEGTVAHETGLALRNMKDSGLIVWHDALNNKIPEFCVKKYLENGQPNAVVVQTEAGMGYRELN